MELRVLGAAGGLRAGWFGQMDISSFLLESAIL